MNTKTPRNINSTRTLRSGFLICMSLFLGSIVYPGYAADQDSDGVDDCLDNCRLIYNPSQRDTDLDGYGNYCDADFDNNLIVNASDLFYLKQQFFTTDPDGDLNGDGVVNAADLFILRAMFFAPPGPSGPIPETPKNLQAVAGDSQVTLNWDALVYTCDLIIYGIYWNTTGGVTKLDSKIPALTSPFVHTGLDNGTTYYYKITAFTSTGESIPSSEVSATPVEVLFSD